MNFAGYIRVSRVMGRAGESFLSPDLQRQRIEGWAQSKGHTIGAWFEDLDQSGGKMERPDFTRMLTRVEAGEFEGVVVAKLDRFARSLTGALDAFERLNEWGAEVVSVEEGLDPTTPLGKAMRKIVLVMAELQRDQVTEAWASAVGSAVARGAYPAIAPFGYRKDESKRLIVDPDESPYVREMYARRLRGDTWSAIARWLNDEGVKPRRADHWISGTVKDMVRHEVYLGVVAKGDYRNEGAHEPLVGLSDWAKAQNVHGLDGRSNGGTEGRLLTGLLRCAACSYSVTASSYGRKGNQTRTYVCRRHHGSGNCPEPVSVQASLIEPWVVEQFFTMAGDIAAAKSDSDTLHELQEAVDEASAAVIAWRDDLEVQSILSRESFLAGLAARADAETAALQALADERQRVLGADLPDEATLRDMWPSMTVREQRELLSQTVGAVFIRRGRAGDMGERARVVWRSELSGDLPRKGVSAPITRFDW